MFLTASDLFDRGPRNEFVVVVLVLGMMGRFLKDAIKSQVKTR